jgi:hypothetical protein
MNSNTDKSAKDAVGLPFTGTVARQIMEELFRMQPHWKSSTLFDRIVQLHRERGGSTASDPSFMIRRALQDLKNDGSVFAPGHGWWAWKDASSESVAVPQEQVQQTTNPGDEVIEDFEPVLKADKEIGTGPECVYLYFNPNDRRLANLEGRGAWECKIGRTNTGDPSRRILSQGVNTALSRLPTLGLIIWTLDSSALENALHSSLRLVGAEVPESLGNEWFIASPARVEAWYEHYQSALAAIRLDPVTQA